MPLLGKHRAELRIIACFNTLRQGHPRRVLLLYDNANPHAL